MIIEDRGFFDQRRLSCVAWLLHLFERCVSIHFECVVVTQWRFAVQAGHNARAGANSMTPPVW
jgi:hypothetical protein